MSDRSGMDSAVRWAINGAVLVALVLAVEAFGQQPTSNGQRTAATTNSMESSTQAPAATPHRSRRRRRAAKSAVHSLAPQTGHAVGETPEQKAADQRLLQQQMAQSQATAKVNTQQVQEYDAARQKVQNEPRIQDAPGPAQTPVPGTNSNVTPDPQGIQEAPGPAQTNPPASSQPAQTPSTPPQS